MNREEWNENVYPIYFSTPLRRDVTGAENQNSVKWKKD